MTRVLLVDDDPEYRLLVRLAFAPHPALEVVAEARDGHEAVELAGTCQPDLVLLDCSMPRADAFDALPGLQRTCPGSAIVLVSGYSPAELRIAARATGALGFLGKDVPSSRLADELLALVNLVDAVEAVLCSASARFDAEPRSARAARRFIDQTLEVWCPDSLRDTVTLLVSELVTNAVIHAGSDADVAVQLTARLARVEVTDRSAGMPRLRGGDDDLSGRGLRLVESLARRWGVRWQPGGGKTIWFEVAREPEVDPTR